MTNLIVPASEQARLLDVLEIDTEVIVLNRRIREAESALIALDTDSDYVRLVREAETAEDRLDDAQRTLDHLESDIKTARARITRDREREEHTNEPKELSELEDEINSLEARIDMLEGEELEAIDVRDELQAARDEIERQLDAFETHWQAPPDHVDGHQHIQQFAGLREPLLEVLTRRYGTQAKRPWLRVSQVAQPGLKSQIISRMGALALQDWAEQHGWPAVAPLLGVYGFDGSLTDYAQHMQGWLRAVPQAEQPALIMCHPALSAQVDDDIGAARVREFAYLASDDFVQHLRDAHVRVVRASESFA